MAYVGLKNALFEESGHTGVHVETKRAHMGRKGTCGIEKGTSGKEKGTSGNKKGTRGNEKGTYGTKRAHMRRKGH